MDAREKITSRRLYPRFYRLLSGPEPFPMKENHPITDRRLSPGSLGSLGRKRRVHGPPNRGEGEGEGKEPRGCSIISIGRSGRGEGSPAF